MTSAERKLLERHLLSERARHERTLAKMTEDARVPAGDRGRPGDDMLSSALGASAGDDEAIVAHAMRDLAVIDRALTQLRTDPANFGKCAVCSRPIPFERLAIVPGAQYCRAHARD